jgi:peptidyl-prolyl cis-trans isomerase SurA
VRLLFIVLALQCAVFWGRAASNPSLVNGIAVIVGDKVITYKDIQLALDADLDTLERRYAGQPQMLAQKAAELERAKLEEMIENQLVLQEFKRAGYVIPESHFQKLVEEHIKKRYGDRLTMVKSLQAEGVTFEHLRNLVRENEILRLMYQQRVPREPLISPTKIENYYVQNREQFLMEDQVKLRMIVLTNGPAGAFTARKMAEEIITKTREKVPFEDLARVYSHGSQAAEGGDWGWVEKKVLREELAEAAFKLEPGQVSAPVETPQAVYVMLVEDKKISYTKSLSEVRDEIDATLRAAEVRRLRKEWVEQLKSKAFVRYF